MPAAGVLEELRLARNCDFSKVVEPNSSSGPSKGVSPVPTDDKEVIPESDDEGDDSGPTHMVAKIRRKTADNLTQGLDSSKAGTRQDYTEGVPRNILAFESRMGARDGKARCCFDGLLAAVRSAESLHLLDLSENGLECDQFTQLRVAFQRDNSELEDGWQSGLLRML